MFTFFDLETTDKIPAMAELLTGYFLTVDENFNEIDSIYLEFKPENYKFDSYKIHGISKDRADSFPEKKESLRKMLSYMKKYSDSIFVCHANKNVFGVTGFFDWQVIRLELFALGHKPYYWFMQNFHNTSVISTHTLSKHFLNLKKYDLKSLADYYSFKFKHHDCIEDTKVMMQIFEKMVPGYLDKNELIKLGSWDAF